jgi:hypothetical protein
MSRYFVALDSIRVCLRHVPIPAKGLAENVPQRY